MAKILHLPLNVQGSEQVGQEKGLREVFEYKKFDYLPMEGELGRGGVNSALINTIADWQPDIIFAQLQDTNTIVNSTLEEIKRRCPNIWLTQWNGDIRQVIPQYQLSILPYFDINYLGFDHRDHYKPYRTELMMIAVDPDEVVPSEQPKEYDVVFIGNHYDNQFPDSDERLQLVKVLKQHFNTCVLGNGWPEGISNGNCPVKDQGIWYNKGKVCISINHFNNIKYYSERLLWCLASGTPTVARRTPDLEFIEDVHYLGFDDINECVLQIERVLHAGFDNSVARQEVLLNHSWTKRAEQINNDYERSHN